MPWSFASFNNESATATVVEDTVVVVPLTVKSPVTVKLSFIVVSEVVCPIEIGTPEVAVPIVIPFDVLELSIFKVEVLSNEMFVPSTTNVPSISVSSKLEVPSISTSLEISKVAAESSPVKVTFLKDEASLLESTVTTLLATTVPTAAPVSL